MRHIALAAALLAALALHAQPVFASVGDVVPDDETIALADEVGDDALDLQGAVNTTQLEARAYLIAVGELAAPVIRNNPTPQVNNWPIGGGLGQRIYCVEAIESTHGLRMYNPQGWPPPYYNEHAQGWLGFLPSTARAWGAIIGNRASEWAAAARMIAAGYGGQFYGIWAGRC